MSHGTGDLILRVIQLLSQRVTSRTARNVLTSIAWCSILAECGVFEIRLLSSSLDQLVEVLEAKAQ